MAREIFKEKQKFQRWDAVALLAFFIVALTYKFLEQQMIHPVDHAMSFTAYVLLMLPLAAALWYVLSLTLSVRVTDKHISVKYSPLQQKKHKIKWEEIEDFKVERVSPSAQWSGWDVYFDRGKTYNLSGRTRLHFKTKNGEDIIVGAKHPNEFEQAVRQVLINGRG